jgi:hypothetical protein
MTLAMRAMIFNDAPPKTPADYAGFSNLDLWRALAREGDRQDAAGHDDAAWHEATAAIDAIRVVMEERNMLPNTIRRMA